MGSQDGYLFPKLASNENRWYCGRNGTGESAKGSMNEQVASIDRAARGQRKLRCQFGEKTALLMIPVWAITLCDWLPAPEDTGSIAGNKGGNLSADWAKYIS